MMYHVFLQVSENDKLKASARDNSASSPRKKAKTREGREGKGREGNMQPASNVQEFKGSPCKV
jgi:predicted peptidase